MTDPLFHIHGEYIFLYKLIFTLSFVAWCWRNPLFSEATAGRHPGGQGASGSGLDSPWPPVSARRASERGAEPAREAGTGDESGVADPSGTGGGSGVTAPFVAGGELGVADPAVAGVEPGAAGPFVAGGKPGLAGPSVAGVEPGAAGPSVTACWSAVDCLCHAAPSPSIPSRPPRWRPARESSGYPCHCVSTVLSTPIPAANPWSAESVDLSLWPAARYCWRYRAATREYTNKPHARTLLQGQ